MAAPTPASKPASDSSGMIPAEWPAQAADAIVDAIGKVSAKTKGVLVGARAVVYGTLAAIVGLVAGIIGLVLVVRVYANLMPGPRVWPLYAVLGAIFLFTGLWMFGRANASPDEDD